MSCFIPASLKTEFDTNIGHFRYPFLHDNPFHPTSLWIKLNKIGNITICSSSPKNYGLKTKYLLFSIIFTCHPLPILPLGVLGMSYILSILSHFVSNMCTKLVEIAPNISELVVIIHIYNILNRFYNVTP